jgi:L-aminopeptidase/D-esterase-like protein
VVAETWDGALNDINGFHVTAAHVAAALDSARGGPVPEGNVGGGTGMICHQFKGGIGTASRVLPPAQGGYTVGVLVQCNYGARRDLRVAGAPVGEEIADLLPCAASASYAPPAWLGARPCGASAPAGAAGDAAAAGAVERDLGSIIVVVATDAPLIPTQLKRIATRVALGIGRTGGYGGNSSGDIFVAFSTAARGVAADTGAVSVAMLSNERITPLFRATVQATEAAIVNALLAAETMEGADGMRVHAMPRDRVLAALRKFNRLPAP